MIEVKENSVCPRRAYHVADRAWTEHLRSCRECKEACAVIEAVACEEGNRLHEVALDAWVAQNDAGCSSLTCPGKNSSLTECRGRAMSVIDRKA